MLDLLDTELAELDSFEVTMYEIIKEELQLLEDRSIDPLRTRFMLRSFPHSKVFHTPTYIVCEIRRLDPSLLDLDIVFCGTGPRLDAGPSPKIIPESWELEYRIWEPYWRDYPDLKTYAEQIRPFLKDWLIGRLTLITKFAGRRPYCWILKRDEELLARKRRWIFPYFAQCRVETRHT